MTLAMTWIGRMTRAVAPSGPSVGPRAKTEAKKLGLRPMEHPVAPALLFQHSRSGHLNGYQNISIIGTLHETKTYFSFYIVKTAFDPPPSL